MDQEQSFQQWIVGQPPKIQLAFMLPAFLLSTWYTGAGENADRAIYLLERQMGVGGREVVLGVHTYLHLIHGDYPFPAVAREFLARSPELVLPILRAALSDRMNTNFTIANAGRIDADEIDNVVTILANGAIFPTDVVEKAAAEIDALLRRLPTTVIAEDVEAHARRYLDSGEVTQRHPAHEFLTRLVGFAPSTRELPARAAALVSLVGPPTE